MSQPVQVKEFPLSEEYKKKTLITPADIRKLRDWMDLQPHLPAEYITDLDLILAYHSCDRSSGVTKEVLDLNLTLKTLFTNLFKNRVVDNRVTAAQDVALVLPLDTRAHDGSAVLYTRLLDTDFKNFIFADCVRNVLMTLDLWQYEDGTWPGLVLLIDLADISIGHLSRLDIQTIQQFLYFLQEAMLVKLKGVHFLNAPSFMDKLMMLLRPFLKKRLMDMLQIHQPGSKTLESFMPLKGLPKEAGGEFKSFDQAKEDTIAKFNANQDYFSMENKKRVSESKRTGRAKTISDIFGSIDGSFKQLDID